MRIVCQQTILIKHHAIFVIFEKAAKFEIVVCCKLYVVLYELIKLNKNIHTLTYFECAKMLELLFVQLVQYKQFQNWKRDVKNSGRLLYNLLINCL